MAKLTPFASSAVGLIEEGALSNQAIDVRRIRIAQHVLVGTVLLDHQHHMPGLGQWRSEGGPGNSGGE
jgi:hypothetical protein